MAPNRLKLNTDKTELIWIGIGQQLAKLINSVVEFTETAVDLGVVLDGQLSGGCYLP